MDLEEITKAAENDNNSHILNLTTLIIHKMKNHILDELQLTKVEKMEIMKKMITLIGFIIQQKRLL